MLFGSSKIKITNLEQQNKFLLDKINAMEKVVFSLKDENAYLKNIAKINKLYLDVCLNINNNNKYLDVLEQINTFYNNNSLYINGISNKDIEKHIKGKKGEIYLLNKFNEYIKENRKLEYFYDFNIQNESQNLQFDFIVIAKNNIYLIEVKNLTAKELELCKNEKGNYYIKTYYKNNKNYSITFNSMIQRYKLINNLVKKFKLKFNDINFNIFNIMVFIESEQLLGIENYEDIILKEYNIEIPTINSNPIQILLGKENIDDYFKNYTSKIYKKSYNDRENYILDDFTKFIKSDISFRESTDKNYIIQSIHNFFEEIYKYIDITSSHFKFE